MLIIKNKRDKPPPPPKPFWRMNIEELNKYSQLMILYDHGAFSIKKKKKRKRKKTRKLQKYQTLKIRKTKKHDVNH